MNKKEEKFLDAILEALEDCDFTYDSYHHDNYGSRVFCIDVVINYDDEDEVSILQIDDIEEAISNVCNKWYGARYDRDMNEFYIGLDLDE